jgi:hypothetical protein
LDVTGSSNSCKPGGSYVVGKGNSLGSLKFTGQPFAVTSGNPEFRWMALPRVYKRFRLVKEWDLLRKERPVTRRSTVKVKE